jgi:hypothetical protein
MFWSWIELLMFAVCEVGVVDMYLAVRSEVSKERVAGCMDVSWSESGASFDIVVCGIARANGL